LNAYYWLLLPSAAFGVWAVAMALIADHNWRAWKRVVQERDLARLERDEARLERNRCESDNLLYAETIVKLTKALDMRTVETPEIPTQAPISTRPKRPPRK
jgi:hypothetical protein